MTVLQTEDDAATANWGSDWRTPTREEWIELNQNTNSTWVVQDNVYGKLFTASNGNTLFLPAGGYKDDWLWFSGTEGVYMVSALPCSDINYEYDPSSLWVYHFRMESFSNVFDFIGEREIGLTVRAVRSLPHSGGLPQVTTSEVAQITSSVVRLGGVVTADGGLTVTELFIL